MMKEDAIFHEALARDPAERAAYLAGACGGDDTLKQRVAGLLAAHEQSGGLLDQTLDPMGDTLVASAGARGPAEIRVNPQAVMSGAGSGTRAGHEPPSGLIVEEKDGKTILYFGDYELQGEVARGAMGVVYRAQQRSLKRTVAIKMIRSSLLANDADVARFLAEAEAAASLDHPNIVPIYEVGQHEDQHYFSMKLIEGGTLRDHLQRLKNDPKAAARVMAAVAGAIHAAHQRGILHRDLKPGNILMDEKGEPHVTDFGLAKQMESASSATLSGQILGTPQYMAPEQARGDGKNLTTAADVYALGAILYELLCGQPPHKGESLMDTLRRVAEEEPVPPTKHEPGVDRDLATIAMKCLSKDPAKRYASAQGLKNDLDRWLRGEPIEARPVGTAEKVIKWMKRKPMHAAAAVLAILFVLTLGIGGPIAAFRQAALRGEADTAQAEARASERAAKAAEAVAMQKEGEARQALAKSQLDLAEKEFERGKFVEAQKILGETPESFRDANWRFLQAHSRDFTARLSIPGRGAALRLQFLPQGDRFAARCSHGVIGIFSLTGRQIGDWVPVNGSGAFRSDSAGGRIAFAASANEVAVQEVATGKLVHRWTCERGENKHVLLSPDGATALVAGGKQLIVHAAQTGAPLWTQPFNYVLPAFSPDGRTVAMVAAKDALALKIELRDTLTGTVRSTLEASADNDGKEALQFNQAGDRLACFGRDELVLWNPQTAAKIRGLHFPGETVKLLSPGGDAVATLSGSRIRLWDTATGRLLRSFNGANTDALDLAFSPDGRMLLSTHVAAENAIVHVWPTRLGEEIASARPPGREATRVVFGRDGSRFYACAHQNAGAWETRGGRERWKFSTAPTNLQDLAIHPGDGSILLSGHGRKEFAHVASTGEALAPFGVNHGSSLKFNRRGHLLLEVEGAFHQIYPGPAFSVLEYPSGKVLRRISHNHPRHPLAVFCLDDAAVASAVLAGGITVWDWQAGTPLRQIAAAQTGSIACLASSPDGLHLATGGPDRWIRVWEAATGRLEAAFRAHWEGLRCVKFSPDGREILSGSDLGTVRINDASTGEERLAFHGLTTPVVDVDISADGKFIAAITTDGDTKVWDRQRSSASALLPKRPAANAPVLPKDAEGWEDLLAPLTPDEVERTGNGWSLKDGELFSPETQHTTLPLPAEVSGTSYQVRVKLRQLSAKQVFHIVLPVANRMCGFELDGRPHGGIYTGLILVNGKFGKDLPGTVQGKQVQDNEPHDLEVTVRLEGANATITTTLDTRPLYEWAGPIAALSQHPAWATTPPGALALGTHFGRWAVSAVKVKRLDGK